MTKEEIIETIRAMAAANGGQPPGVTRLRREAGIKSSDWCGRYWARWGDALREAGFRPNRWKKGYEEDYLLRRLASLLREMGRVPTAPELQLKRRSDPTLPSDKAYRDRLGGKAALMAKLRAYCKCRPALRDVLAICDAAAQTPPTPSRAANNAERDGYVYLLRSGRFYKIGRTNCVGRRERELALLLPQQARRLHTIKTDDPAGVEAYWHRRFAARRKNGEFFELRAEDVSAFKRWRRI
ncbi:MAG: GIY-YIG nuclease family protein [Rhodospirillaceae bacterium]|nr:GIY-YIG nuclease family protein [Rhodospirillaceae bacterium]